MTRIAIDADQNGLEMKRLLIEAMRAWGFECVDLDYLGRHPESDYPDVAHHLAGAIQRNEFDRGILICGTGLGMAMCANKVRGVYAGTCHDVYSAERLSKSNNAQVLTLGALVVGAESAKMIVRAWLRSDYQGGPSARKVDRMRQLESESFAGGSLAAVPPPTAGRVARARVGPARPSS
ncbi:MAG: RpiB/LacA/LacB family sugar-phosphate isomerase [Pirellulales bacterium]|nr:RpiB/LacA/LacB family sugar-phosphate isomerase [Pirellulales bacterium]